MLYKLLGYWCLRPLSTVF